MGAVWVSPLGCGAGAAGSLISLTRSAFDGVFSDIGCAPAGAAAKAAAANTRGVLRSFFVIVLGDGETARRDKWIVGPAPLTRF